MHVAKATNTAGPTIKIDSGMYDGSAFMGGIDFALLNTTVTGYLRQKEFSADRYGLDFGVYGASGLQSAVTILGSGNVGIGTTSPASLLHINGTNPTIDIDATSGSPYLVLKESATWKYQVGYDTTNNYFQIYTTDANGAGGDDAIVRIYDGTDDLIIPNGNVGIGTTTPSKQLVVNGTTEGITFEPNVASPVINTTTSATNSNLTITSSAGSVIIRLG